MVLHSQFLGIQQISLFPGYLVDPVKGRQVVAMVGGCAGSTVDVECGNKHTSLSCLLRSSPSFEFEAIFAFNCAMLS